MIIFRNEKIVDIITSGDQLLEANQDDSGSLQLLKQVIPFTIADATADLSVHPQYMAEDITAFGLTGKEAVLAFKERFLGPQGKQGLPAYKLDEPFKVHVKKRMVSLGFECLIKGYLGFGTDYVFINQDNLINCIDVERHSSEQSFLG